MNNKEEFINIVEAKTEALRDKYKLTESIHQDFCFEKGLIIGMEALNEYIDSKYVLKKKLKTRGKRVWKARKPQRKRLDKA